MAGDRLKRGLGTKAQALATAVAACHLAELPLDEVTHMIGRDPFERHSNLRSPDDPRQGKKRRTVHSVERTRELLE